MLRNVTVLLWALIGLGSTAGLYGATKRYQAESRNRRVELALDYAEVKTLADMTGQPVTAVLNAFKQQGVRSVAIAEDTIAGLESRGMLTVIPNGPDAAFMTAETPSSFERIESALNSRGLSSSGGKAHSGRYTSLSQVGLSGGTWFPAEFATVRNLGVGLDPAALVDVRGADLQPVARISNWPGVTLQSMATVLNDLKKQKIQTVIFQGTEVLGYRGLHKEAAETLQAAGLNYGEIEFGKQKGDEKLAIALKGDYVRVHSISDSELGTLDENEVIDRFVRAARERNIRLCYIRLPFLSGDDPVRRNADLLESISRGISRGGEMSFGLARPFQDTTVPRWFFPLIAIGTAAGFTLLILRIAPLSGRAAAILLIVIAIVCALLTYGAGESGRKIVALLAALVFPALACLRRDILNRDHSPPTAGISEAAIGAVKGLAIASAITTLGIAQVVGLLATRPFMLRANQFMGIKAAHAIPIVLIGVFAIAGLPRLDRPLREGWAAMKAQAAAFFGNPIQVGQLLIALAALAAFALIVMRTGNEPGVGVSGVELKFRSIMDRFLPVRPRTKEFLIGHPAFVLGIALYLRGRVRIALPLFVVGVIGQVSILNTFCHIHTPLMLSLIRDVSGLIIGTVLGLAAFWLIERCLNSDLPDHGISQINYARPNPSNP